MDLPASQVMRRLIRDWMDSRRPVFQKATKKSTRRRSEPARIVARSNKPGASGAKKPDRNR